MPGETTLVRQVVEREAAVDEVVVPGAAGLQREVLVEARRRGRR